MSVKALDKLGEAIVDAGYDWTPEMRKAYENGIRKSKWVGLTWDEIDYCFESCVVRKFSQDGKEEGCVNTHEVAKAIEAKLKEKNT